MSATGSCEERHDLKVLVPYDRREAIDVQTAAKIAARGETTIRQWCAIHHIGRRVGGGPWQVSRVALQMFLDGNTPALRAYLGGDRATALVAGYFASLEP